jgi:ribose/xylose/arabinose/galactoside ABC-type transport system permease subunit
MQIIADGITVTKGINLLFVVVPVSRSYERIIVGVAILLAVTIDSLSEYLQNRRLAGAKKH